MSIALAFAISLGVDPYSIFERAERAWRSQHYPVAVDYMVHVETLRRQKPEERHYRSRWFALTNNVAVDPTSLEERAHPYHPPPGVDVSIFVPIGHIGGPNEGTGTNGDLIGVPVLAPNYSFGIATYVPPEMLTPAELVAEIRAEFHDPAPEKIAQLEQKYPKTIAHVFSSSSAYKVALVGIEQIGDHSDYHLSLSPTREPGKYRLRDIWVNESTFATDKLRTEGNFVDAGTASVPWTVTFQHIDGAVYIERETSERPIRHWFDSIGVSFEGIVPGKGRFDFDAPRSLIREP
jgi:hypothetical protein